MPTTTIRVSVNVATGNMHEGNGEFILDIDSSLLGFMDFTKLGHELEITVRQALVDYRIQNNLDNDYLEKE